MSCALCIRPDTQVIEHTEPGKATETRRVCKGHAWVWKSRIEIDETREPKRCRIVGCAAAPEARGLCKRHWNQASTNDALDIVGRSPNAGRSASAQARKPKVKKVAPRPAPEALPPVETPRIEPAMAAAPVRYPACRADVPDASATKIAASSIEVDITPDEPAMAPTSTPYVPRHELAGELPLKEQLAAVPWTDLCRLAAFTRHDLGVPEHIVRRQLGLMLEWQLPELHGKHAATVSALIVAVME